MPLSTSNPIQEVLALGIPQVREFDAELISHFLLTDAATFNTVPGLSNVRYLNLPEKAPQYPYLLYGLLSISALHLRLVAGESNADSTRSLHLVERARTHQQLALSAYIARLGNINSETCQSIFTFSVILAGLGFGFLSSVDSPDILDADVYVGRIVNIFELLRGAVAVADEARTWIVEGESARRKNQWGVTALSEAAREQCDMHTALQELQVGLESALVAEYKRTENPFPEDILGSCTSSLPELSEVLCQVRHKLFGVDILRAVLTWPGVVPKTYVALLRKGHPAALVVVAYYGVALHALGGAWWLRGAGFRLVRSVTDIVTKRHGQDWQDLLQWPLSMVEDLRSVPPVSSQAPEGRLVPELETTFDIALRGTFYARL